MELVIVVQSSSVLILAVWLKLSQEGHSTQRLRKLNLRNVVDVR